MGIDVGELATTLGIWGVAAMLSQIQGQGRQSIGL